MKKKKDPAPSTSSPGTGASNLGSGLSAQEITDLQTAKNLLENPSVAARITHLLGTPLEKGLKALPASVQKRVASVTETALKRALSVAVFTMENTPGSKASNHLHMGAAALLGVVGGAGGLAALSLELPVSTTVIIRSIMDIARSEGEDISSIDTQLACLEVFALGGSTGDDDEAETGYFAVRAAMAKTISDAAAHLATSGLSTETAPALVRLIVQIGERFSIQVTPKAAAQMIPGIGAIGGAAVNTAFTDHFQSVARGHFMMRRLIKKHGALTVQDAYDAL